MFIKDIGWLPPWVRIRQVTVDPAQRIAQYPPTYGEKTSRLIWPKSAAGNEMKSQSILRRSPPVSFDSDYSPFFPNPGIQRRRSQRIEWSHGRSSMLQGKRSVHNSSL